MDVRSHISYVTGCMMYKVVNGMAPPFLKDFFKSVNCIHSLNTRQSKAGDLYIHKGNTNHGKITFQYKGCELWSTISSNIQSANNFVFKVEF